MENYFDIILVDAPCSGEGLFRKDVDAVKEWSEENIDRCIIRQKEILDHAYNSLKHGGCIIYSTCTFEEEENDKQVELLCERFDMDVLSIQNNYPEILRSNSGLIFFPHRIKGEGFYLSVIRKKEGINTSSKRSTDKNGNSDKKYIERFLNSTDNFTAILKDDRLYAIPYLHLNDFNFINRNLYVRLAGINIGEFKGDDLIPSAALALSCDIKPDLPNIELSDDEAIHYLKGNNIHVESVKGWVLVKYKNFNLGWIKNLGSRINNYYPKEWRIRKGS